MPKKKYAFARPPRVCRHNQCRLAVHVIDDAVVVCSCGHYSIYDAEAASWRAGTPEEALCVRQRDAATAASSPTPA